MTIAFSPRQVQEGLAAARTLAQAEAIYFAHHDAGLHEAVPLVVQAPALPAAATAESPSKRPALAPRLARTLARLFYRAIRPVARPLAWRTRGFLQRDVMDQLHAIRDSQANLLAALQLMQQREEGTTASTNPLARRTPAPLRRKIHQFHAGSATGDAITNAMFLIQRLLRARGYDSEIFVEHLAPGLEQRLHPLAALPRHDDHVLLVHHSMGHAGFDRVLASPAPKVLIYHNITPPELLAFNPFMQRAAELGRRQLKTWRNHVVAALADSAFNGVELRKLGFLCVREATLLFDVDHLLAKAIRAPQPNAPYTVLFVGREVPSKGQADLVEAFARFANAYTAKTGRPARLVLAGAGASDAAAYRGDILERITRNGLTHRVLLTGALSDHDLHNWYAAADLYVSLSRHEGFGVPLIEAMAYKIPVLALRVGAVPATMAGAGILLETSDPALVATRMLEIAADEAGQAALIAAQIGAMQTWRIERHLPRLMEALHLAGAAPPEDNFARTALRQGVHFTLTGATPSDTLPPALSQASPGRLGPALLTGPQVIIALDAHHPGGQTLPDLLLATLACPAAPLPLPVIRELNACFDGVLVESDSAAHAVIDSGITIPVRIIGHGIALPLPIPNPTNATPTGFLHICTSPRASGTDLLLAAWARAFRASDRVSLAITVPEADYQTIAQDLASRRADDPELAEITLHSKTWPNAAILVQPAREDSVAEPAARALATGMHLIVTGHGGHLAFCATQTRKLHYSMQPQAQPGAHPHALWAEPDLEDLILALREAQTLPRAKKYLLASLTPASHAERVIEASLDILTAPKPAPTSLAWLSPWNVRCGIAQYSRHLLGAFDRSHGETIVFTDHRDPLADAQPLAGLRTEAVFRVGEISSIPTLVNAITAEDPDILVIQHQAGILPWDALAELLEHHALTPRVVVVSLHNSRDLLRSATALRQRVAAALARCSRILVHAPGDLGLLGDIGVTNTVWLPHGTTAGPTPSTPRNLLSGDSPLIGTTGFVLPHKGIQRLITAIALLRASWPGIRLRLVTSRYPDPVSDAELAACEALIHSLHLESHIEWHTEFAPNDLVLHRLSSCDLLVMPYAPTLESSSGAVRQAIASGVPTLVSDLTLFDDLADAVERLPGTSPETIAARIDAMLRQPTARAALQGRAQAWLEQHDWSLIAERLQGMLIGLHAERLRGLRYYEADNAIAANGGCTPSGIGHS
jgi:glycosyltransferase involved in cell wall biosynthesis